MMRAPIKLRHMLLASVVVGLAAPTFAQAVNAIAAPVGGSTSAPFTQAIPSGQRDTVNVNAATAVINWTPTDLGPGATPVNFLPAGNELRFTSALGNYTVLNRIVPISLAVGRAVAINGTVESLVNVNPVAGFPGNRGGNVWFYSPNGILAGATSRFNIGSLALTTLDHPFNAATGALTFGLGGTFQFGAGLNPVVAGSSVVVAPGAQIDASAVANSYVALISPRVEQRGSILVNGAAALVAGERVDVFIGFNNLFSINVLTGSGDANGIVHTGSTVGTARSAANPNGQIYMTAVPKNQAITMLVGGTSGYQPATSAAIVNGAVVLTSGYNVQGGTPGFTPSGGGTGAAGIRFTDGGAGNIVITSNLTARASGILSTAIAPGTQFTVRNTETTNNTVVAVNADFTWDGTTAAGTSNLDLSGVAMVVSGNLSLKSGGNGAQGSDARVRIAQSGANAGSLAVGGTFGVASSGSGLSPGAADVTIADGTLTVGGATTIDASSTGLFASGTGGTASLTVNGGTATFNGSLSVLADGIGQSGGGAPANGTGGTARINLGAGATATAMTVLGTSQVTAQGISRTLQPPPPNTGGSGIGGTATITIASGTLTTQAMTVNASGSGGDGALTGGLTRGGTAQVAMTGGQYNVSTLTVRAEETQAGAANGGSAGSTAGAGVAAVDVTGGTLNVGAAGGNGLTISANALKAPMQGITLVGGGNLLAGTARLSTAGAGSVITDATANAGVKPNVQVTATAIYTDTQYVGTFATSQRGGTATVEANGGTMSLHGLSMGTDATLRTAATANPADPAGPAFGGTTTLAARNGGSITVRAGSRTTVLSAFATGGSPNVPALGTGGTVNVLAQGGTLALPDGFSASVIGYNGTGAAQGGVGGTINVQSTAGAAAQAGSLTAGVVTLDASGQVNAGSPNGTAGTINVSNVGTGQTMTFANLFARAGAANGGVSGAITLTADNTPIITTANFTGIDLLTLGTLTLNGIGAAGTITANQVGIFGTANDIIVSHTGVTPASTSTLSGSAITLQAGRDQLHNGSVTLRGADVLLVGRRTLGGVDSAVFSTGDIRIGSGLSASANGVRFRILDAGARLRGYQGVSSETPEITTPASFVVSERVTVGAENIDIRAGNGIDIASAGTNATGQVLLSSTTGDVTLSTSGVALATRPNNIVINALGGVARFTNLNSRSLINISGRNGIVGGNAAPALGLTLASSNGGIAVGNLSATSVTVTAAGSIAAGTVLGATGVTMTTNGGSVSATSVTTVAGAIAITGATGITVPTISAAGNATLNATNGAVRVATNLAATGTVTASGQSLFLRSVGNVAGTTFTATGASGVDIAAGGTLTANAVQSAGGPVTLGGANGIAIPTVVSGGATSLTAPNGAISVATNLQSAGAVTASARSVTLRATGGLNAASLIATAGDANVSAGADLTATTVQASNDAVLGAGNLLTTGTITAGRDIVLTAQSLQAGTLTAPRDLRITTTGIARATGPLTATGALVVNAGQTNFQALNGGSVTVNSGQGVIFTTLNSAGASTLNAGDDAIGGSVTTGGNLAVTAGRNINFGPLQVGGNATLYGNTASSAFNLGTMTVGGFLEMRAASMVVGNVTVGTDAILSTFNGGLSVGDVTAGDDIFLTVNGSSANPNVVSPDPQLGQASATQFALTAGNLRSTGLGSDTAASGPRTFTGAGPTDRIIRVRGSGNVNASSITSPGQIVVVSDLARVTTGNLTGTGGIAALARSGVGLGAVDTNGLFVVRSADQYPLLPPDFLASSLNLATMAAPGRFETQGAVNLTSVRAFRAQVNADGAISFASIVTGGRVDLTNAYGTGSNAITGGAITAAGALAIQSNGAVGFTNATTAGAATLSTTASVTGTSLIATAGPVAITGTTGIAIGTLESGSTTALSAANGAITVATDLRSAGAVTASGRTVTVRSTGALSFADLAATAGNADATTAGALTIGQATASGALALASGGVATINGIATGATVSVVSPDIVIAANGRLGTLGTTTQLTLTNNSTSNRTTIGGAGTATGYSLSGAEIGRLFANSITVNAPVIGTASTAFNSARLPDVTIDAFTFAANNNLGANGGFAIVNGGKVRVVGAVSLTGMTNSQTFAVRGDEAVEVLDAGSIALGGTGGLAGILDLTSRNIVASSSAALADFAAASTLGAITDRAGKNDGAVNEGGWLQANAIRATLLSSTLIIQNTGTATTVGNRDFAGRRGFTVGAGGLTIVQGGTNPMRIAINGRQAGATTPLGAPTVGGFVTGLDMTPLIRFVPFTINTQPTVFTVGTTNLTAAQQAQVATTFDLGSTNNGCAIVSATNCRIALNDPVRDALRGDFGQGTPGLLPFALIQLRDFVPEGDEPLIDEPVTGSANDDLWAIDDTKCDPAKEKCEAPR